MAETHLGSGLLHHYPRRDLESQLGLTVSRMRWDARTRRYVARRTAEGKSKREIIRCLIGGLFRARLEG